MSPAAAPTGGPFYLVPSTTTECQGIKNCLGSKGPWVAVSGSGDTSYLFGCPQHIGFIVAGTDAGASSATIRVTYSDRIGGRLGPPSTPKGAAVLLFQAASNDGRPGWFQPIVGCVSLFAKNKRATTSAGGTTPASPPDLRAENLVPRPAAGLGIQRRTLACPRGERPVSSWSAYGLYTPNPPDSSFDGAVTVKTEIQGRKVVATFHLNRPFSILAPRLYVQIGAACEP
jgi:hypothetical protein